jgi:hypothetical protein
MKRLLTLSILALFSFAITGQHVKSQDLNLSYLGQKPPGITPEPFAPDIIATGYYERDITISPDGTEIFYGILTGRHVTILYTRLADGKWTEPEIAPFARNSQFFFLEPCFSPDGNTIYFLCTKPPEGKEPAPGWAYQNIWASDKKSDGTWGEIYNPDTAFNRPNSQFYPSLTKTGTLYFTRSDEQTGKSEILRAKKNGNKLDTPELLPPVINANGNIYNAFISPDESYLIGCVDNKKNEINPGFANYYIFFRDKNDNWNEGISFGPDINIKGSTAISASVSPDGKYLFFSARTTSDMMKELASKNTIGALKEYLNSPQNGNYDIYWVSAGVIDNLRPKKQAH